MPSARPLLVLTLAARRLPRARARGPFLLGLALAVGVSALCPRARAEAPAAPTQKSPALGDYLALLAARRLAPPPALSVDELEAVLDEAHERALGGRKDEATMLLLEAVEGRRFERFESLDAFQAAELSLASLLIEQRALLGAQRALDRLLARGPSAKSFGPAFQRAVDVALLRGDYAESAARLAKAAQPAAPEDAADELAYLRGLAHYDRRELGPAARQLAAITPRSRFYPSAQYLLGAIAAAQQNYDQASQRFCALRELTGAAARARYGAAQLYPSRDLAQLGLARVAHERGRQKQAFDHYFRIPSDSPLLAEALFEAAYASYERGRHESALDSLDQLAARYPRSPLRAEAELLRGYALLGRCDFAGAERAFASFERRFDRALQAIDAALASPARARSLFSDAGGREASGQASDPLLHGLVLRDPALEQLEGALAALDAELARSRPLGPELAALAARVRGTDAPRARRPEREELEEALGEARLGDRLAAARSALAAFARELRALRGAGAARRELAELERKQRALAEKCDRIEAARAALAPRAPALGEVPVGSELGRRIDQDRAQVLAARVRARRLRGELEAELARAEQRALRALRARLEAELRRAQLGRVDAVMGQKRKHELAVESLAAGRATPELASQKPRPALLRDDQEYWPFEGENWPDEFAEPAP